MEIKIIPQKPIDLEDKIKMQKFLNKIINKPSIQALFKESFYRLMIHGKPMTEEEIKKAIKDAENE